jgi:hypothetical protein
MAGKAFMNGGGQSAMNGQHYTAMIRLEIQHRRKTGTLAS